MMSQLERAAHGRTALFATALCLSAASLRAQVVINEIHYDPEPETEAIEFIELHNAGSVEANLGGWRFTEGIAYTFPPDTVIPAGGFLVVGEDPAALNAKFGVTALGPWDGRLSNDGETLTFRDASGNKIDEVDYQRGFPWPACPDGSSMELLNPVFDNDLGGSWRSSDNPAQSTNVTYIPPAATGWLYFKGTEEPSSPADAWRALEFVEGAGWQTGQASFGYGDDDDNTTLSDMRNSYSSVYLHKTFVIAPGALPPSLLLRVYVDDGAIIWINTHEVGRPHVGDGFKAYDDTGNNHEAEWEEIAIPNPPSVLVEGTNVIAVHALNTRLGSSDFSIDIELKTAPSGGSDLPSPGAPNRVAADNAPPAIRQVRHEPERPHTGEPVTVTVKVTDPDGVQDVALEYQPVAPGAYVRATDAAYKSGWSTLTMHDDGTGGDALAADDVYTAVIPGAVQQHRRLVRYRVTMSDTTGLAQRVPYDDDLRRNFAYFVYDGVPAWTAADAPGTTAPVTYPTNLMAGALPVYHLVALEDDVEKCQYNSGYKDTRFYGTMVYDGRVYDHIQFKVRGEYSTYRSGKNKWRFYFNPGDDFQARGNGDRKYKTAFRRMNFNGCSSPWVAANRGMAGLDEAVSYRLYELAGVKASKTHFVHFRIVDDADEAPADQYTGDLWGLYIAVEHIDGRFLDERDLPDGNTYKIAGSNGEKRNQGPTQSEDSSDWNTFRNATSTSASVDWWRANFDLPSYYSFRAVNRAVSNIDLRDGANFGIYHHTNGLWFVLPQDLDMMFLAETHWSGTVEMKDCLARPEIENEFRNRCRELIDLMFSDASPAGGQAVQVIHDLDRWVNPVGEPLTFADVDQFMWNYHPRTHSSHRGQFYVTPKNDSRRGGSWTRTLVSADHEGFVQYLSDFMTDTDPDGFTIGDGDQRGYGYNYLEQEANDTDIPDRPSLTYTGDFRFPVDGLRFRSTVFSDSQGSGTFGALQWRIAEVRNPSTPGYQPGERWRYEIDATWESDEITTPDYTVQVPPVDLVAGRTYRVRVRHKDNTERWSHWSEPMPFTAGVATGVSALAALVISELHYHPVDFEAYQFIEFHNPGISTLDLSGVALDDGVEFVFPAGTLLAPGACVVVVESLTDFGDRYLNASSPFFREGIAVAGQWTKDLDTGGETLRVEAPGGTELFSVRFSDGGDWPERADGRGSSAELIEPASVPGTQPAKDAYLADGAHWQSSGELHGTPGSAFPAAEPTLVINELLSHSDAAPGRDWVELANVGTGTVGTADLYLSDTWTNLARTPVAAHVGSMPRGSFAVLDENALGFAFSELGDEAILSRIDGSGRVTFLDAVDFGASARDVTFGRHVRSDGETDFTAMSAATRGGANAYPLVGPVVVSEIMYAPTGGVEFIELSNLLDIPLALRDPRHPTNTWKLTSAVGFVFPADAELAANGTLIVTRTNEAAFRAMHPVAPGTPVFGPWDGALDNAGETVRLRRPGDPEPTGEVPYILAEKVNYRPTAPWPERPQGSGRSLERTTLYAYGSDPANWRFSESSFGTPGDAPAGKVHMVINKQVIHSGTGRVRWSSIPGETYSVEYRDSLLTDDWTPLQTVVATGPVSQLVDTTMPSAPFASRFYRVRWVR